VAEVVEDAVKAGISAAYILMNTEPWLRGWLGYVAPTVFLKTFVKGQGIVNTSSVSPAGLGSITDGRSDLHNTTIVFIPFPSNRFRIQLSRSMPISYSCERRILPTLECMLHKQTDLQTPCITFVATVCRRPIYAFLSNPTPR
jgi:hypothetical protein